MWVPTGNDAPSAVRVYGIETTLHADILGNLIFLYFQILRGIVILYLNPTGMHPPRSRGTTLDSHTAQYVCWVLHTLPKQQYSGRESGAKGRTEQIP